MPRDELAVALLVGSFAAWGVIHAQIALKLAGARPRWRGVVALCVPPLAVYWAARTGHRVLAVLWGVALATWVLARIFLAR